MFRHGLVFSALVVSLTLSGMGRAENGSDALDKLPAPGAVVSVQANLTLTRISCVESDHLLNEIQTAFFDQSPIADVAELRRRFKSFKTKVGTPQHPVYLLQQDVKVSSDSQRTRNESFSRSNGHQHQATQVKVGGTYVGYENGNAVLDTAGIIQLEDIGSLFPYRLVERFRTMRERSAIGVEVGPGEDGAATKIVFSSEASRLRAEVFLSDENLVTKTRLDQGAYIEECYYAGFEKHEGISVPMNKVEVRLVRGPDHKTFVSGCVELTEIRDVQINSSLGADVFAVAIPHGTLVQKFDGVQEIERVVTTRPVADLRTKQDSLSALGNTPGVVMP